MWMKNDEDEREELVFFGIKLGKFEAFREDVPEILGLIYGFKI